ncbi:hypothetical protein DYST_00328 [Dyella terrae]|nr:hypothetical protein DYST_00328 [Dyella terrae]
MIAGTLLLGLLLMPSLSAASGPPAGMSHIEGLSFTKIYSDDKGRLIAIIPEDQTADISQACEAHKPLWLYGKRITQY